MNRAQRRRAMRSAGQHRAEEKKGRRGAVRATAPPPEPQQGFPELAARGFVLPNDAGQIVVPREEA